MLPDADQLADRITLGLGGPYGSELLISVYYFIDNKPSVLASISYSQRYLIFC